MSTLSPARTGDDLISVPVLNVQAALPLATSTAWRTPERSPMKTRPPPTAGDDSPMPSLDVSYFHFSEPSERLTAWRAPDNEPTNTTPSAMAADDSIASPAS
jgi:hypothetical protein